MHPKQVPIVVALSMMLGVLIISTALVMLAGMHTLGLGMMLLLALCSIMLGRYLPSSDARGLLDVYRALEDVGNKLTVLSDRSSSAPISNDTLGMQLSAIAVHLAKIECCLAAPKQPTKLPQPTPERIQKRKPTAVNEQVLQRKVIGVLKSQ